MRRSPSIAGCRRDFAARWKAINGRIMAVSPAALDAGQHLPQMGSGRIRLAPAVLRTSRGGGVVQRTIRIGRDPLLVQQAEVLLERCRQRKEWLDEIPGLARLVAAAAAGIRRRRYPCRGMDSAKSRTFIERERLCPSESAVGVP